MKISLNLKNPKVRNPLIVIFITAVIALLWHQYFYTPSMETLVSLQKKTETKTGYFTHNSRFKTSA
jgi:hypothetical protein